MSAGVRDRRNGITVSDITTGTAIRGTTWQDIAQLWHWVLGRGANLIPANLGDTTALTTNHAYIYKYWTKPRFQAVERLWAVHMRSAGNDPTTVEVSVPDTGTATTVTAIIERNTAYPFLFREVLSAQSATAGEMTIEIKPKDADLLVESISCWEIPRAILDPSTADLGADEMLLRPGQPITVGSAAGLIDAAADDDQGRRASLIQWAVPSEDDASSTDAFAFSDTFSVSANYVDVWQAGIPILARMVAKSATTGTVSAKFLARVTANDADLRLNSSVNGASSAVNITTTTYAWSNAVTLAVDADDLSTADGRQGAAWDELQVNVKQNTGGTCYVVGISIWED